jgi:hypothetical protein
VINRRVAHLFKRWHPQLSVWFSLAKLGDEVSELNSLSIDDRTRAVEVFLGRLTTPSYRDKTCRKEIARRDNPWFFAELQQVADLQQFISKIDIIILKKTTWRAGKYWLLFCILCPRKCLLGLSPLRTRDTITRSNYGR